MSQDHIYARITDTIISRLEQGVIPWQRPWEGAPMNLVSKKEYRGINSIVLGSSGFGSPYWASFDQVKSLGGSVLKGSKSSIAIFWKRTSYVANVKDENGDETGEVYMRPSLILRYYNVFNLEQTEGIKPEKIPVRKGKGSELERISICEQIVEGMPKRPPIVHKEPSAFYRPSSDIVNVPSLSAFRSSEEYYSTLFHELTHSTGHEARLNRKGVHGESGDWTAFGTTPYAKEELVAEMGASFLCGQAGIDPATIDNSAAYIDAWLGRLKKDKKLLVFAAAQAQKAADFILGRKYKD